MGCVAIAGGGTGGHIFPALAVTQALATRTTLPVVWIGSRASSDRMLVESRGLPYYAIPAGKLRRYLSLRNLLDVFNILAGIAASLRILLRARPVVLFSKGGFVSVPPTLAAWALRIPVVSHECDLTPGLATRINALFSRRVLVSYPQTARALGVTRGRIQVTGNPVRAEIMAGSRERGRRWLGVAEGRPVVLVTGGSTGARALNQAVEACRERLALCCHLVHQRGRHPGVDRLAGYQSAPFYGQVFPDLLAAADLVVCRAGANSLSELSAWGLPAILVPLPLSSSRGDQIANAAHRARAGAAVVLNQADLDGDRLAREIMGLLDAPMRLHAMRQASAALAQPGAAALIAGVLMAVARRPHAGRRRARRPAGT